MKKEPTEALKFLYSVEDPTDNIPMHLTPKDKADHVCRLAFKEGQSNPKIKPLEWDVLHSNYYVKDTNPVGYIAKISEWNMSTTKYVLSFAHSGEINAKIYDTLEEAKAAAQEDFETRIRGCLKVDLINQLISKY